MLVFCNLYTGLLDHTRSFLIIRKEDNQKRIVYFKLKVLDDKGKADWSWIEPVGERHEGLLLMVDMMLEFGSV